MPRSLRSRPRSLLVLGALSLACSGDPYGAAQPREAGADAKADAKTPADPDTKTPAKPDTKTPAKPDTKAKTPRKAVPERHQDGKPLGRFLDNAPLPLADMLGQEPAKVEAHLGPPLPDSKGGTRNSCVRYIPDRTWFKCKQVWQRYSDKTSTFSAIHVVYEDGKASALNFEGVPGAGNFEPQQALRKVGVEVPGKAKVETPQDGVTVWSWFNSSARLLVHGRQYRVRVSTVGGKWDTSKVEIVLNDALDESEKARMFTPGADGKAPAGKAG